MDKNTPIARAVRTFALLLAGAAPGWAGVNLLTDFKPGATKIGLAIFAALLGALVAYLWAVAPTLPNAHTPLWKAVATFLEGIAGGLATFTLAAFTVVEFERFGMVVVTVVSTSFTAALIAFCVNLAEDKTPSTSTGPAEATPIA